MDKPAALPTVTPWKPPTAPALAQSADKAAPDLSDEAKLIRALKEAQSQGATLPAGVAEVLAKVDDVASKQVTKSLHDQTTQLGQARRQVQQLRQARAEQMSSWQTYVNSALQALEKGLAEHEQRMERLQQLENQAAEKAQQAQKAIQSLSKEAVVVSDQESEGDDLIGPELLDDGQTLQAQKKLRMTLEQLKQQMPEGDANGTPKRRLRDGVGATGSDAAGLGGAAPLGGSAATVRPPPN